MNSRNFMHAQQNSIRAVCGLRVGVEVQLPWYEHVFMSRMGASCCRQPGTDVMHPRYMHTHVRRIKQTLLPHSTINPRSAPPHVYVSLSILTKQVRPARMAIFQYGNIYTGLLKNWRLIRPDTTNNNWSTSTGTTYLLRPRLSLKAGRAEFGRANISDGVASSHTGHLMASVRHVIRHLPCSK